MIASKLTVEQAILLSGFTGFMLCEPEDFLADLNARLPNDPPFTLDDLNAETFQAVIQPAYVMPCSAIVPVDWSKYAKEEPETPSLIVPA